MTRYQAVRRFVAVLVTGVTLGCGVAPAAVAQPPILTAPSSFGTSPDGSSTSEPVPAASPGPDAPYGWTAEGNLAPGTSSTLAGGGSSFVGVEMVQWTDDVTTISPPLQLSYNPTSSGDGRTFFRNGTDAYGVSDIPYQGQPASDPPPGFSFDYIPIVAGGLSFMYNLPGDPALKLNASTACGIFTGEITNWDDTNLAALNPGVTLPNLAITPVLRGDLAGTNWVLEDWCMTEAPQVWGAFVTYVNAHGTQPDSPPIGATTPSSAFPVLGSEQTANGDSAPPPSSGRPTALGISPTSNRSTPRSTTTNRWPTSKTSRATLSNRLPERRRGAGLRPRTGQRHPGPELRRQRVQRLQPVDLFVHAGSYRRVVRDALRADPGRFLELCADHWRKGGSPDRLCQYRLVPRTVRHIESPGPPRLPGANAHRAG